MFDPAAMNPVLTALGANAVGRAGLTNEAAQLEQATRMAELKLTLPAVFADATAKGDTQTAASALYTSAQLAAHEITDGNVWQGVVERNIPNGTAVAAAMNRDAWKSVGIETDPDTGSPVLGTSPSKDQQDRKDDFIRNNLVQLFMESGQLNALIGGKVDEVYTDQGPGRHPTGRAFEKKPDFAVTSSIFGNANRDRTVTRRQTTKSPYATSSYSETER